jgi:hypothetical protein
MIRLSDYAKRSLLLALWGFLTLFALLMLSGAFLFSLEGSATTVAAIVLLAAGAMAMVATAGRWWWR